MKNLFLTGEKSVGKTTLIKEALKILDLQAGGYTSERVVDGPIRTYLARSLYDNRRVTIARVDSRDWSKKIYKEAFAKDLIEILDRSYKKTDLLVVDELGFMEKDIEAFTGKIFDLLDSDKTILGVLKDYDCEFLNKIRARDDVYIIEVTEKNRDRVLKNIIEILDPK